jgi:hypothetical protein
MPTLSQARKAWEHGRKSKNHYDALTPEQKSAFWQFGRDNGLVDPNNLDGYKKSEFDTYVKTPWVRYAPTVSKDEMSDALKIDKYANYQGPKVPLKDASPTASPENIKVAKQEITPKFMQSLLQTTPDNIEKQSPIESLPMPKQSKKQVVAGKGVKKDINVQGKLASKDLVRPDNPLASFAVNALNTASLGLLERNTDAIDQLKEKAPVSSTIGSMAGYLAPFSAAKGAVVKGTQTLGKRILTDAALGAGIDTATEAISGKNDFDTSVGNVAKNTAFGIGADIALSGLGAAGKAISKIDLKAPKIKTDINPQPINKTVANATSVAQEVATTIENADSFMAKINVKPKKKTSDIGLKLRTDLVDKLAPLEDVEKAIKGKIDSAEKSLYKTARNYFGTPEKAHEVVRTQLEPTLKEVQKQGYDIKELAAYAEAVHAKDVNAAGIKSGFTDAEIDDVIKKYSSLEPFRQELQKVNNFVIDELVDGQVISPTDATTMRNKWKNYMPLFRSLDDNKVEFGKGMSQTFANVSSPIKTLKGSDKDVIDPIESMIKNVFQGVNAAERNKVGLQLANLATEDIDGTFIRKLAANEEVGRKNVLNVKELGGNVKYEVNPELYKAMLNLDKESSTMLIKILSKPAGLLRAGATLTPEFAARNPMRDVLNAYITSKSGFNPFTDFGRGLASAIKKDELYTKFIMSKGAYGESISMDRNLHREILEKTMKTPSKQFVDIVSGKSLMKVLRAISDTTEKATKIGEFGAALRKGETVEEAAYRARDLMDFARSGNSIKEANKVVAFLNANIQGKSKFIRAIKEDPKGVSARIGKAIALPSIAVFTAQQTLANDEQKAIIQDAPDWLRDTFWLLPIPGTNQVARVPKPFDFAVFGNTLERFLAYTVNNDKEAFDNFARSTVKQQSIPTMLTGLVPIIEGMTNYSFFRDAPIVPQREAYLNREDQFDTYTSELSKKIAGGLKPILGEESNFTSPRIVDNTIRGVTAGLGGYGLDIFDIILGKDTQKPAKNVSQMPILKGFLVNENSSGKSMETLYDDKDKLTREKNSAKLKKLPFENQQGLKKATVTADKVSDLTKQIREITNSQTLTPKAKRDKINELTDLRNKLTRDYKQGK